MSLISKRNFKRDKTIACEIIQYLMAGQSSIYDVVCHV